MFRLTRYIEALRTPGSVPPPGRPPGPVVIWNLIRRCNLACKHCYATSADIDFAGELSGAEIDTVMDDLRAFGVPVLILSGGEPLMHPEIHRIARRARDMGFFVGLSTNGTLIDESNVATIAETGFDYVGISLDGLGETHDRFRKRRGAFDESVHALRLCRDAGIKVGVRFTLAEENAHDLPGLLQLVADEDIDKFYLSHLNYAGRGNRNRRGDAVHRRTRWAMDLLFRHCLADLAAGRRRDYVTGNNDADAVYLLHWAERRFPADAVAGLRRLLRAWGGNASGSDVANIDNLGNVHPDTFWWQHNLGNVRERPFSAIWSDDSEPMLAALRRRPRPLEGRCGACAHRDICGGNTRTRAWQLTGNLWAEDPGCYLDDTEIGLPAVEEALS
ncbi:heme d1 biosynthesis radical SAM protein NirJ [Arhodomonas sp. KWT]|uniref:heme d1 biosynthesis radical SAM protein NirJ n=1 Tax=Arhodomonas sp. KWT TaxID=2679915 RepID=UPI0013D51849|nr:heme d1 biosynthesis radical SAM protein NirJ [Arhodomonas sp. KWT]